MLIVTSKLGHISRKYAEIVKLVRRKLGDIVEESLKLIILIFLTPLKAKFLAISVEREEFPIIIT